MKIPKSIRVGVKQKDFRLFKKHFTEYQKLFGLMDYKVYFKFEPLRDCFADITVCADTRVATVRLDKDCSKENIAFLGIRGTAKHEALHLLLWDLQYRACSRYVREGEIDEVAEGIVHKLVELIK